VIEALAGQQILQATGQSG